MIPAIFNKSRLLLLILALYGLHAPVEAIAEQQPPVQNNVLVPAISENATVTNPLSALDNTNLPQGMLDLMQASRSKYLEGSNLIKAGNSNKARESFDKAVDLLLQSDWDLPSTPKLMQFFQDLVQQIQEDESRYLPISNDFDEGNEASVLDELNDLDLIPIEVDPALKDALTADLATTRYGIPITINEMVLKSMNYWLSGGRKYFADGLKRSGQYRSIIEEVFREESIPLDLMYLAQVESLFKPHAISKAKAKGIWQFTRSTAKRYGLKVTWDIDERSDPVKSTRAAARYLKDLFAMFKDWNLALAAYNWGEGKVQRLINRTGLNDFWQLVDSKRRLPKETKNHVPMIQASVILGRNPEKYGFPTDLHPPLHYINVSVSKPIDLRAAAKVLNTSLEELRRLNPALKRLNTPPNYPDFQLKVPADSDPDIHAKLAALPKARTKTARDFDRRHKVRKGETLYSIAALYGVSIDELADANDIVSKNKIRAGRWLLVPSVGKKESKRLKTKRLDSSIKPTKSTASIQNARSGKDAQPDSSAARIKSTKSQQKTKRSGGKASF